MIRRLTTVDAHAAGQPIRIVVGGFPDPAGETMAAREEWVRRHADPLRRALMLAPRGQADLQGLILTRPVQSDADAGVLAIDGAGYPAVGAQGVMALATAVVELGILTPRRQDRLVLDGPGGQIRAEARIAARKTRYPPPAGGPTAVPVSGAPPARVAAVAVEQEPCFVVHAGLPIRLGSKTVRVDVAFAGAFYAIIDAEAVGVPIEADRIPELRRVGAQVSHAAGLASRAVHPTHAGLSGIHGTILTGPARSDADLRSVTVSADGQVERSPGGPGTGAVMAVFDGMSVLPHDRSFVHEGILNTTFESHVQGRTVVGEHPAIVPVITGTAWVTGEHRFVVDDEDPLRAGYRW